MPKAKIHSGASKRFKKTGSGKLRHEQQNNQHKFLIQVLAQNIGLECQRKNHQRRPWRPRRFQQE